jgi:hypothetical protein
LSAIGGAAINNAPNPFGGFAPFPNSIMIPFMGYQSAVLGFQFGVEYEFGKRIVKSMSNETFNHIRDSPEGREFFRGVMSQHHQELLTDFREALPDAQSVMNDIIQESVQIEIKKAERTPSAMAEIIAALGQGLSQTATDNLTEEQLVTWQQLLASFYGIPFSLVSAWFNTRNTEPTEPTPEPTPTIDFQEPVYHSPVALSFSYQVTDVNNNIFTNSVTTGEFDAFNHALKIQEAKNNRDAAVNEIDVFNLSHYYTEYERAFVAKYGYASTNFLSSTA